MDASPRAGPAVEREEGAIGGGPLLMLANRSRMALREGDMLTGRDGELVAGDDGDDDDEPLDPAFSWSPSSSSRSFPSASKTMRDDAVGVSKESKELCAGELATSVVMVLGMRMVVKRS